MGDSWTRRVRGISCVLLLALLAVCGYIGADTERTQTVSVSMTRETMPPYTADSSQDAASRLKAQREEEIALLQGVIDDSRTEGATRQSALTQMTQIVSRMEMEAQSAACLARMGYEGASAVCGAELMTLLVPYDVISEESDKTRIIDAVCGVTGFDAGSVKIILTKK